MKLTNQLGLPDQFLKAYTFITSQYDKQGADYSATELLQPPRMYALKKKFKDELSEDVAEHIHKFYGSLNHHVLEKVTTEGAERRYHATFNEATISGSVDFQKNGIIYDYKFTSVGTSKNLRDYSRQLNIYAELMRQNHLNPQGLRLILVFRDWKKTKTPLVDYPPYPVEVKPIQLRRTEIVQTFIIERIDLFRKAEEELPLCSDDERWMVKGVPYRCKYYCPVSTFCSQHTGEKQCKVNRSQMSLKL